MPPILSKPSSAAKMAMWYVTIGTLIVVWTVIWYVYLNRHNASEIPYFWCYGLFFTGLALLVIGLALGRIGRAARHAELPPEVPPSTPTAQPAVTAPGNVVPPQGGVVMTTPGLATAGAPVVAPVPQTPLRPQPR